LSTEAASRPQKSCQDKKIPDLASAISLDKKSWKTGHPGNPANGGLRKWGGNRIFSGKKEKRRKKFGS
jgi:hypothetical protein